MGSDVPDGEIRPRGYWGDAQVAAAAAMSAEVRLDIGRAVLVKWLLMNSLLFVIALILILSA